MARIVKEHEYIEKRNEILAAAQRLVYSKGYERMTIGDILAELKISSGAFYHYFDSKAAVLEAFIQRIQEESEKPLLPIVHDPQLSALEKLQGFFSTLDQLRLAQKRTVVELLHVWYTDENAIVRQKVDEAVIQQRAPLLTAIVEQGIAEGSFTNAYPQHSGAVILTLLQGMGNAHAKLMLTLAQDANAPGCIDAIVSIYAAYMDAIERVLGAPSHSLQRVDKDALQVWLSALHADNSDGQSHLAYADK